MNAERWKEIDELLHAALERSPKDRSAFLIQACKGDDSLRIEVESLISYPSQALSFLERPAFERVIETSRNPELEPNPAVLGILEDYLSQLERGTPSHPNELLSQHPEVAPLLREHVPTLYFLHRAALKLRNEDESRSRADVLRGERTGRLGYCLRMELTPLRASHLFSALSQFAYQQENRRFLMHSS